MKKNTSSKVIKNDEDTNSLNFIDFHGNPMPDINISDDESNLTINKKAKINTKQDGVVDNKKDVDGNSSDYEDLLPYSNKDTREQHFQNEENMALNDASPISFMLTRNSTQTSISKKRRFLIFDDLSDDGAQKGKQVDQDDKQLIDQSPDNVYHLDDFVDDVPFYNAQDTSRSKKDTLTLIDEESVEDLDKKNSNSDCGVWININDLPYVSPNVIAPNNLFDDEGEEELKDSDINILSSTKGEDDLENFIDDEDQDDDQSTDDYEPSTDDESTDDDM